MKTTKAKKGDRVASLLNHKSFDTFKNQLRGEVITSTNEQYDKARLIWNGLIDNLPAFIVRCRNTSDVVDAVNFARKNELLVSILGSGHNVAGNAVCDAGMLIDLSAMKGIHVDPATRTARVQPGAD